MVVLGRIIAPFGVRGWLKVHPFGDEPEAWRRMPRWWIGLKADGTEWQPYELKGLKAHGKGWIACLEGVVDRIGAERLDGAYIAAPRDCLPEAAEGEYYWADLVGLRVVNDQDVQLGTVAGLMETGANAVLVVREGDGDKARERLLPFVAQVVRNVDLPGGCIRVDWQQDW
jgi:16S rRNA processing protein RimM